jgi:myosin heavy subunit
MKELMEELDTSDVHFVRCIKPNEKKEKYNYNVF